MIPSHGRQEPIFSNGIQDSKTFQIAVTAKTFDQLSSGIYSKKVRAVVRELSTNAYDAHVYVGKKNVPYDVNLPTTLSPFFRIRDYGPGLSDEEFMGMYTTYFESGQYKLTSNDYVGCFGLGSKSPFSYTTTFAATSYHNGIKRCYSMYRDENRIPRVSRLSEEPTIEPNGLEIVIPVQTKDCSEFVREAADLYRYFTLKPNVVGYEGFTINPVTYAVEGQGWGLRSGDTHGGFRAVMGNVYYQIPQFDISGLTTDQNAIIGLPIDVRFNIGDLDVMSSRERLSYDETTLKHLKLRLDVIIKEVRDELNKELQACKNLWEAKNLAYDLSYSNHRLSPFIKVLGISSLTWNGKPIGSMTIGFSGISGYNLSKFEENRRRYGTIKEYKEHDQLAIQKNILIVENDLTRGAISRCRHAINETYDCNVVYLFTFESVEARKAICERLGCDNTVFKLASSLPSPPRKERASTGNYDNAFEIVDGCSDRVSSYWVGREFDEDEGGVFVEMDRFNVRGPDGRSYAPDVIYDMVKLLRKAGDDVKVYGIRKRVVGLCEISDDWVNLWDYMHNYVRTLFVSHNVGQSIADALELEKLDYLRDFETWMNYNPVFSTDNEIKQLFDAIKALRTSSGKLKANIHVYGELKRRVNFTETECQPTHSLTTLAQAVFEKYPMLTFALGGIRSSNVHTVNKYVEDKDNESSVHCVREECTQSDG